MADLERIAYDNALRALDKQERLLEELRARTGVLIAASSIAVSLLGRRSLDGTGSAALLVCALIAFLLSLGASLYVLLPSDDVVFAVDARDVYERLYADRNDGEGLLLDVALTLQAQWEANGLHVDTTRRAVQIAALSLGVEVLALTVLLLRGTV